MGIMIKRTALALVLSTIVISTYAQDTTCPALFQTALTSTQLECTESPIETICYGNSGLSAAENEGFDFPGSTLPLINLKTFKSKPMDTEAGEWGLAIIKLASAAANEPTIMLSFGDVELSNLAADIIIQDVQVISNTGANVRTAPNTDAQLLQSLIAGQTVMATGRLEDSTWLQVQLPNNQLGWILADLVRSSNENLLDELPIVDPAESADRIYRPMRAFAFRSGINDAPCGAASQSGILIQTPGEASTPLSINGHDLEINGTVFLQAEDETQLAVRVLEGTASISFETESFDVAAGDEYVLSDAAPVTAFYDYNQVEMLPFELLPRQFLIASNWETLLIPAKPQPLAEITPSDTCTIAVVNDVNVRVGPGRDYTLRGSMLTNQSAEPTGRAVGTDGRIWWRITGGAWISFDVTFVAGDCNPVPLIDVLPRQG